MNFEQLISNITPDIHASLKKAVELRKWPDGRLLTSEQLTLCMEAVISYEHRFIDEKDRVGYIDKGSKSDGDVCDDTSDGGDQEAPLKWT
jgi:uncharacterized protein YeaC (DUF1315 family)|tara:strand:+ start:435 stop:704 length:270 start_codon:yes stop_codon:yes gene_type:complete